MVINQFSTFSFLTVTKNLRVSQTRDKNENWPNVMFEDDSIWILLRNSLPRPQRACDVEVDKNLRRVLDPS